MSNKLCRKVIETALATWAAAQSPALKVAYENKAFTKPAETYLKGNLLPAETASDDLTGNHLRYAGLYQISIYAPIGGGPGDAETIAAALATLFPLYSILTDGTFKLQIASVPSAGVPDQAADRFMLPVSFRYRADVVS